MRKWLAITAALVIAGLSCLAQAQAPNVRAVIFPPRVSLSYSGPGDFVSGAQMFVGLTAYNAAYAAPGTNPAADICDSATMTTCVTINILSTGYFDKATASASAACATSCSIKKLYDQTAHGNDYNTNAGNLVFFRIPLLFNCLGSLPCLDVGSNTNAQMTQALSTSQAQPYTIERVNLATANSSQFLDYPTNNVQTTMATNVAGCFAGSADSVAAADTTWLNINITFSNTTSDINIQGTDNPNRTCGTATAAGAPTFPATAPNGTLKVMEFGFWPSTFSAANSTSISGNRKTVYGY